MTVVLPNKVAIAGDAHGNELFVNYALRTAMENGSTAVVFVGDFWFYDKRDLALIDQRAQQYGLDMVYFIDGNHEDYRVLTQEMLAGTEPVKFSDYLTYLPRGYVGRFECGMTFMTFGGAVSIDYAFRREGVSWFRQEMPVDADLMRAVENAKKVGGQIDVLLCHDVSTEMLAATGKRYPRSQDFLFEARSENFSRIMDELVDQVAPRAAFHGHHHVKRQGMYTGGPRPCFIQGMGADVTDYAEAVAVVDVC